MMLTTDELWLLEQALAHKKGLLNHRAIIAAKSSSRVLIQQDLIAWGHTPFHYTITEVGRARVRRARR
jgi:hypothetical protein